MKRITLLMLAVLTLPIFSFAGGIVHNTNQSAAWVRMFARDASTDIDAVFYNPAGLTNLGKGFYVSINSQTLFQNRLISSDYQYLNTMVSNNTPSEYEANVTVPSMPSIYAAYNFDKLSISFGFNVIGGGGSATFENGLPAFELPVSDLVPSLAAQGQPVSSYSMNAYFEGSSAFYGYQLGASYAINDMISVYLGARYVTAKNTYNGYLKDVMINFADGSSLPATNYFTSAASALEPLYVGLGGVYNAAGGALQDLTLAQAAGAGYITPAQQAGLEAGLTSLGIPLTTTIGSAYENGVAPSYLGAKRAEYVLADQEDVDVEQSGSGITPIIGVNINLNDKLNIGLKYEHHTKIELENNTPVDFIKDYNYLNDTETGMFPDGELIRKDMPSLLTVGADYKAMDKLKVSAGFHYYFDKGADYGYKDGAGNAIKNSEVFDANYWEVAVGAEYNLTEKFLLSIGYLRAQSGLKEEYQTDLDYKISSNSFGLGGAFSINSKIDINIAAAYTAYVEDSKATTYTHDFDGYFGPTAPTNIVANETYNRSNLFFGIGLDFKLGKSE